MNFRPSSHNKSSSFFNLKKVFIKFSIISILLLILLTTSGSALADSGSDSLDLGWILFYITLIVLIVIVILWVVTYFIMRKAIKQLEAQVGKVQRYEDRKDRDRDRRYQEKERDRKRRARAPKGNCLVCTRKFIPGADAYQCDCGKYIHVHCLSGLTLCPHCGREIDQDYGVVRLEDDGRGERDRGGASRTKINRLIKAKFCPVCTKIIKAGDSGMECDNCSAVFHIKCSDKTRKCPKCGR